MPENLISARVSPIISFETASMVITLRQSDPPSEIEYATLLPSFENLIPSSEVVPSLENVFGSRKSSGSPPSFYL